MESGTLTAALLADNEIEAPPAGAAPDNVTVQVLLRPPNTDAGTHWNWESTGGVTVRGAILDPPP
jgi:hypothetical protein